MVRKAYALVQKNIVVLKNKGAFHIVAGSFMTKFVSFFGSIFIVRLLSKSDYGILSYYENFISYFTIMAGGGLASGLLRFMVLPESIEEKKGCLEHALIKGSTWNVVLVLLGLIFFLLYPHPEAFSGHYQVAVMLTLCIPFVFFLNSGLSSLRALFDNKSFAIIVFVTSSTLILARVAGAALGGLNLTTSARLGAEMVSGLGCLVFLNKKYFSRIKSISLKKEFVKTMDTYSLQMMLTDGLWAIFMLNDLFLLGQLSGNETILADYKVAYVIPANLSILNSAVGIFVAPYFTKQENEKNFKWVRQKFLMVLTISSLIMAAFSFVCFIFAKPLILLLYGDAYISAVPIMRILLIASFFNNGIRATIANILSAMGIQKINLYIGGSAMILQIILDIILIPRFGGIGVAWTSLVVYACMSLALGWYFWNKYYRKSNSLT